MNRVMVHPLALPKIRAQVEIDGFFRLGGPRLQLAGRGRQIPRQLAPLGAPDQRRGGLVHQRADILADLVGRTDVRFRRTNAKQAIGDAVDGSEVSGLEAGHRRSQPGLTNRRGARRQRAEQLLSRAQTQLAGCPPRERDRHQAVDGERRLRVVFRRHELDDPRDQDGGLAGSRAGVDEHVARLLQDRRPALRLVTDRGGPGGRAPAHGCHSLSFI